MSSGVMYSIHSELILNLSIVVFSRISDSSQANLVSSNFLVLVVHHAQRLVHVITTSFPHHSVKSFISEIMSHVFLDECDHLA
jgi:hypothetical protein